MKTRAFKFAAVTALAMLTGSTASAHLGYTGRTFPNYTGLTFQSETIAGQTVTGAAAWADGTDLDFSDSHKLKIFRFSLENTASVSISVTASNNGSGTVLGTLLPGFSVYSGLAHLAPFGADHDGSAASLAYLASLPGPAKEGVFVALESWKVGNDDVPAIGLTTFDFKGYAVDGTAANFGPTPGIVGDGLADGFVTGTFTLGPGDYSFFVGGGDYAGASTGAYGITTTVAVAPVPEPASMAIFGAGAIGLAALRRRRK